MDRSRKILLDCVRLLFKPLVQFCLRHSIHVQEMLELVKVLSVEVAQEALQEHGEEDNISRIHAITGLHRRDVRRINKGAISLNEPHGLVIRVIGRWQTDRRFQTKAGKPMVLGFEGASSEFHRLVSSESNDIDPGTILFELERIGAVERTKNGLKLISRTYVPRGDATQGFLYLSLDYSDLLRAVEENVLNRAEFPQLHGRTEYDNIAPEAENEIRQWFLDQGALVHQRARSFLAEFDRDINPNLDKSSEGLRVVLGTYGFVEEISKNK